MESRYRNLVLFLLTAVFFGGTFAAIKVGLGVIPPVFFAALRFDIGGILLFTYAIFRIDNWRPRTRADWSAVIATAALFLIANNVFLFLGQQFTSSAIAAVMYSFSPVLTPIFALVLLENERLSRTGIVGIVLGFVGIAIVASPDPGSLSSDILGMGLVLIAAASVALGGVVVRRVDASISSVGMMAWAMIISAPTVHVLSAALGESVSFAQWTSTTLLALAYVGIFATAIAYTTYFVLLNRIGPIKASLNTYVTPIVAAVIGWVLLSEPITVTMVVGFVFIFGGFALLERETFIDGIRRLPVSVSGRDAPGQESGASDTQQHRFDGGSVQSGDRNSCDD